MSDHKTESRQETQTPEPRRRAVTPAVDIYESREDFLLVADLPGVRQEDLSVRLDQGELRFEGVRKARGHGAVLAGSDQEQVFRRVFTLPGGIDADKIEAKLTAGVLQLRLPKAAAFKPRQINITTG